MLDGVRCSCFLILWVLGSVGIAFEIRVMGGGLLFRSRKSCFLGCVLGWCLVSCVLCIVWFRLLEMMSWG